MAVLARIRAAGSVALAIGLALAALGGPPAAAATRPSAVTQEYDLKAVFLFHFAEFVEWPTAAFQTSDSPLTIGILGEDPFGATLDQIVADETVRGRRLLVRRFETPEQVDSCQILFISRSEAGRLDRVLPRLGRPGVLTVGDAADFVKENGIIGFFTARDRLKLRINLAAATAAGLTISSKLLRQAEIVKSEGARQ